MCGASCPSTSCNVYCSRLGFFRLTSIYVGASTGSTGSMELIGSFYSSERLLSFVGGDDLISSSSSISMSDSLSLWVASLLQRSHPCWLWYASILGCIFCKPLKIHCISRMFPSCLKVLASSFYPWAQECRLNSQRYEVSIPPGDEQVHQGSFNCLVRVMTTVSLGLYHM